jgi:hypothetical protein
MNPSTTQRIFSCASLSFLLAIGARAQAPPSYTAEFLGPAIGATAINRSGQVILTQGLPPANERGFVAGPGSPLAPLPLPPGRTSSRVYDINDAGVIAGSVSSVSYAEPSFGAIAALWIPNGSGGYTIQELGKLPGDVGSAATALNDVGDVVGYSQGGMFRRAVWFTAPSGILDLDPIGIFDPRAINDQRVLVDGSFTAKRLDLDTMIVEDLGVPTGLPTNYVATSAAAINSSNQVAGLAILATSTDCDRVAARYTDGIGWEVFSGCGSSNGCGSINDLGDVTMRIILAPYVRFEGIGAYRIEDLIVAPVGQWYLYMGTGQINDARQIAVAGTNPTTGQSGLLLLSPVTPAGTGICFGDGSGTPCPCANWGSPGHGCANGTHPSGALLTGSGSPSVGADTLILTASASSPGQPGLFFQGDNAINGGNGSQFGDGLRCAGGGVVRIQIRTADGGGAASTSIGIAAKGGVSPGDLELYQWWYRDPMASPCGSSFNLSNALSVSWLP